MVINIELLGIFLNRIACNWNASAIQLAGLFISVDSEQQLLHFI